MCVRSACHLEGMWSSFAFALAHVVRQAAPDRDQWLPGSPIEISRLTDRCLIAGTFHRASQELMFVLEARPTTDLHVILINAPGNLGGEPWEVGAFSIRKAKIEQNRAFLEPSSKPGTIVYQMTITRAELDAAGIDPQLEVRAKRNPLEVSLIGLSSARPSLDACSSDLLDRWGYSKEIQRGWATYPRIKRPIGTYASYRDYPPSAVRSGAMGEAHVLVDVGTDGRASNCRIVRNSGHREIDAKTCEIVTKRARYEPARSSDGTFTASPAYLTMRWELSPR